MLKGWIRDLTLSMQAKSGASSALLIWIAIAALAALMAFLFLCLAGYHWFELLVGPVFGGLIMAGIFALIAAIGALICGVARRRTMERAILARAARAHAPSWWLDPKILAAGVQAGRALGWQRIVPFALLGFMAAQWAREHRGHSEADRA